VDTDLDPVVNYAPQFMWQQCAFLEKLRAKNMGQEQSVQHVGLCNCEKRNKDATHRVCVVPKVSVQLEPRGSARPNSLLLCTVHKFKVYSKQER